MWEYSNFYPHLWFICLQGELSLLRTRSCPTSTRPSGCLALGMRILIPGFIQFPPMLAAYVYSYTFFGALLSVIHFICANHLTVLF